MRNGTSVRPSTSAPAKANKPEALPGEKKPAASARAKKPGVPPGERKPAVSPWEKKPEMPPRETHKKRSADEDMKPKGKKEKKHAR